MKYYFGALGSFLMTIKYNFGILKNSIIGFKINIDNHTYYIGGKCLKVTIKKDSYVFEFEDRKFEVREDVFSHMQIEYKDGILYFIQTSDEKLMSGLLGFTMFDTFGFPYELTQELLDEQNLYLDMKGVESLKLFSKEKNKNTFKKDLKI